MDRLMSVRPSSTSQYKILLSGLQKLSPREQWGHQRNLARTDLYFLLRFIFGRRDIEHPWLFARIREVEQSPDGHLDLWPRDHRKSTVITYGKTIQDILASHGEDPLPEWQGIEPTFGIFSHTRPIAKSFLRQIKRELEQNETLKGLFPDVLYERPDRDSPQWSEDNGLVVRRKGNPKEATIEAWGLVDGQPTAKHFDILLYDDVVVRASVTNPDMIQKTTNAWSESVNLGTRDTRMRGIGTRWHYNDTYREIIKRGALAPRIHKGTDDGTLTGRPLFLTGPQWDKKVREMGPYVAAAQLLMDPRADSQQTIKREWLRWYDEAGNARQMNRALLVDPASEKKRDSDYTAMAIVGFGPDGNVYVLDLVRDRLNLTERASMVMELHRKWQPRLTGYEKYGKDSDIEYIQTVQNRDNYRFEIQALGGKLAKADRINRLIPWFSNGQLYLPRSLYRTQYDGKTVDIVTQLVEEEILPWPVPVHDDVLDAMARVFDLDPKLPWPKGADTKPRDRYARERSRGSWMSA